MKSPILLEFKNKKALIVGGGKIGLYRAGKLRDFGCDVTILTPEKKTQHEGFQVIEDHYHPRYLRDYEVIVAATDRPDINEQIIDEADRLGILLISSVTQSEAVTFSFPAVIHESDILISISTGGNSPAFTKYLKEEIQEILTEEILERYSLLKFLRRLAKSTEQDHTFFKRMKDLSVVELRGLIQEIDEN